VEAAVAQLAAASQSVLHSLPTGMTQPSILRYNASSVPILQISISSDTMSESSLYDYGYNFIRTQMATVQGASNGPTSAERACALNSRATVGRPLSASEDVIAKCHLREGFPSQPNKARTGAMLYRVLSICWRATKIMPTTTATVNPANAYRQIITNFSNPLEFVREAVSNSIDADATNLSIVVEQTAGPTGQPEIRITISDDGHGMDERTLERFFNLGDSEKSDLKGDADGENGTRQLIGEKGFGTKFYLNSRRVEVRTTDKTSGAPWLAVSQGHLERIHAGQSPQYEAAQQDSGPAGTEIKIY